MEETRRDFPNAELFGMMSGEYLDPQAEWFIKKWTGAKRLFELSTMLFFPRWDQSCDQLRDWAKLIPEARIEVVYAPSLPISATLIRERIKNGRSIRYLTDPAVETIVKKAGSFRTAESPTPRIFNPFEKIKRVALFIGSFNPLTFDDLVRAEYVREEYEHDRTVFVPLAEPEHNREIVETAEIRFEMCVAGCGGQRVVRG